VTAIEETVVTGAELREFMRSWATGVAVVTSALAASPIGCTVNAFTSVSLDPPLLMISLAETSRTLAVITARQAFGVNLLAAHQDRLAARFAGAPGDRFAGVGYRMECGVPVLTGVLAAVVCAVVHTIPIGDHVLLFGRPLWRGAATGADPAVFFGGRYRSCSG
jgi:flavin reductase (DIM6/NTAB) family NADH-FMN oxidoreductase RutF